MYTGELVLLTGQDTDTTFHFQIQLSSFIKRIDTDLLSCDFPPDQSPHRPTGESKMSCPGWSGERGARAESKRGEKRDRENWSPESKKAARVKEEKPGFGGGARAELGLMEKTLPPGLSYSIDQRYRQRKGEKRTFYCTTCLVELSSVDMMKSHATGVSLSHYDSQETVW